jgi:hypothetical protein
MEFRLSHCLIIPINNLKRKEVKTSRKETRRKTFQLREVEYEEVHWTEMFRDRVQVRTHLNNEINPRGSSEVGKFFIV